ncbi:MAG: polymer-forming cytoskeletal protein [Mariprofundaceae bacterium]|nr:polymer-forming cytoskeletal protein [Mariprofundaceae bacterium]
MLRKREKNVSNDPQHIDTLIGVHSIITGELSFEGAVRIDGRFSGNIHADKDGTLIVSEGAIIQGEVHVPSLILHGTIEGNVYTSQSLKLGSTGHLNGDVQYKVLSLAEGSAINGRCNRIDDVAKEPVKTNKQTSVRPPKNQKLQEV